MLQMSQILILKGFSLKEDEEVEALWFLFFGAWSAGENCIIHYIHSVLGGLAAILPVKTPRLICLLFSPAPTCGRLGLESDGKVPLRLYGTAGVFLFIPRRLNNRKELLRWFCLDVQEELKPPVKQRIS